MDILKGKVAVVTGSTSGIGLACARAFAGAGADIVLNGIGAPRVCRKIGRGSRVGDGPRQIRIRVGEADARRRPRDLERPRRRCALLGILDRATKQLGRNHPEASRAGPAERAVRGWAGDGPASRQNDAGQACRPYLSVTAAATNFLRPALPGLVPWAAHQSGNVAGSM
jgi:hypothetical protein